MTTTDKTMLELMTRSDAYLILPTEFEPNDPTEPTKWAVFFRDYDNDGGYQWLQLVVRLDTHSLYAGWETPGEALDHKDNYCTKSAYTSETAAVMALGTFFSGKLPDPELH